ncbi:MAG: GMP synthase [Candidatus Bathyarchaeota archaeon]|nr:GMP synthase [Candidatus Bathyarchaeota archaeon]
MQAFNPQEFIKKQVAEIKKLVGNERALIAVSGGVDSATSAVLTFKAIGNNLLCVMLDDAFMREGEPQRIAQLISQPPIKLPIRILDVQERFLNALKGLQDAEEKRKIFRENFYKVLGETAKKEKCKVLVQGTIKADIVETTGGVKTQHNVLGQIGINTVERYGFKVVEPLVSLYKEQVRMVARHLGIPSEIAERQPFPGPGLSIRVVGEIRRDKLESEKKTTVIVEETFAKYKPSQYFAAILDNKTIVHPRSMHIQEVVARLLNVPSRNVSVKVFEAKATGVKGGKRMYGGIAALKAQTMNASFHNPSISRLVALQATVTTGDPFFTRIIYMIKEKSQKQPYVVILRAIQTHDFLTAKVTEIPWATLNETADKILKACPNVSAIYYDVTPKPPATVEME